MSVRRAGRGTTTDPIPALPPSSTRRTLLFLSGLAIFLSANAALRIQIGGLLFQPVIVPVALLWLAGGGVILRRIPNLIRVSVVAFLVIYCVVEIVHGLNFPTALRMLVFGFIVLGVAGSISDDDDVRAASLGLVFALAALSLQSMIGQTAGVRGINPLEGVANRNAFSLYALPAVLLGGYHMLAVGTPSRTRILMGAGAAISTIAVLSTANRSGYLGLLVIIVLLGARGRRPLQVVALCVVSMGIYAGFTAWGDTSAMDLRLQDEDGEIRGLDKRRGMFDGAVNVGLNNPILGVGKQQAEIQVGQQIEDARDRTEIHNVFGEIIAGGGVPLTLAFATMIVAFLRRPKEWAAMGRAGPAEKQARGLLRITLLLLLIRGMFTGAVLTTPGFMLALGIALGASIAHAPRPQPDPEQDQPAARTASSPGRTPAARDSLAGPRVSNRFAHPRTLVQFDPWSQR
jgi:hypothetical protein